MSSKHWRAVAVAVGLGLTMLGGIPSAHANMSSPWRPGEPLGEPLGATAEVRIVQEDLHFDLRPLATGAGEVPVTVRYEVDNPGAARDLELAFLAPGLQRGRVTLDGKPLPTAAARKVQVPPAWQDRPAPTGFADVDGDGERERPDPQVRELEALPFAVPLPSGRHVIQVAYQHRTARLDSQKYLYRIHLLRYLLAPAERWGGFGGLRVHAEVPEGWQWRASPELDERGGQLAGSFDRLPQPWLQISLRRPEEFAWFANLFLPLGILGLALAAVAPWRIGRRANRGGLASALAVLSSALVAVAPALGAYALWHTLLDGTQTSNTTFYGYMWAVMLLTPVGAGAGLMVGGVALLLGRRRRGAQA